MRAASLAGPSRRLRLVCLLLLSALFVLAARAAHLTVFDSRGRGWGERQIRSVLRLPAPRGLIVDRKGVELAITIPSPSVYVVGDDLEDRAHAARLLARVLDLDERELRARLEGRRRFGFVKRWASREQAEAVTALGLPGVGIVKEPRRAYPAGALAGQLIGFANIDGDGVRGVEQQLDDLLRGHEQAVTVERTADRRLLVVDPALPRDLAGSDVRLTLDAAMQAEAEGALAQLVERARARAGCVITVDVRTGDILALAEYPPVDPNVFRSIDFTETRSRAFLDAVEPGSTLKSFLVAGALDAGVIRPDEHFDTGPGWMRVPGKTIRDHRPYGVLRLDEALMVSSNVVAVLVGQRLEARRHHDLLRRFGFGHGTGSGFPQESAGLLRDASGWKPVDHAAISYGQGLSVTPIQLAAATAALANGGVWQKPRLVDAVREPGGEWKERPREVGQRVVSRDAALTTLRLMESVVRATGTGRRAALDGLRVAGKTGTAQKFDREAGRYSKTDYLAWFIGAVPAEDPSLAITVLIDEPAGPAHGGGDHAAPLFAKVASAQLAHLGIVTEPARLAAEPFRPVVEKDDPQKAAKPARLAQATQRAARPSRRPAKTRGPKAPEPARAAVPPQAKEPRPATEPRVAHAPAPPPAAPAKPSPAVSSGPAPAPETRLIPDFRGETLASARSMAAAESLRLELVGDQRGLAVEQHPAPGTIVTGDRARVRLRFASDPTPPNAPRGREREG